MRGYVDTDWGQIHYRAGGHPIEGASSVIALFHESPRTSAVYDSVLESFADGIAVLAFDTPGFGQSDSAPEAAPIREYGRIMLQALDALGVERVLPVGMKTGSSIVTSMAILAGQDRVPAAVLYSPEQPDDDENERWALTWAPELDFSADGSTLTTLFGKNVGLYGTENPRVLYEAVADAVGNADRYNSIYPAVFRGHAQTWNDMHVLAGEGVALTFFRPAHAQMTASDPIVFADIPGTEVVEFAVTGQFPLLAHDEFVAAVARAAAA